MAANPDLILQRNIDIQEEYQRLCQIKKAGISIYRHEYMLHMLSKKFYLTASTIERILKLDLVQDPAQLKLSL